MVVVGRDPKREVLERALDPLRAQGWSFSEGAEEMLYQPLAEHVGQLNEAEVTTSIAKIVAAISKTDDRFKSPGKLLAVDIIAGFWGAYCSIPPFCGRR